MSKRILFCMVEEELEKAISEPATQLKATLTYGDKVQIQRFATYTEHTGKIEKFLEKNVQHCPDGIKVELENGMRGHAIKKITSDKLSKEQLFDLIRDHEGLKFELKESYFCDTRKTKELGSLQSGNKFKIIICKTISSFMNTEGGIICIGISDAQKFCGFDDDFQLLCKNYEQMNFVQKKDDFTKDLEGKVKKYLGQLAKQNYDIQFLHFSKEEIEKAGFEIDEPKKEHDIFDICLIILPKSEKIVYFREHVQGKNDDGESADGQIVQKYERTPHGRDPILIDYLLDEI